MKKELMMGNQAIASAAIDMGVSFVTGYPGTPSTEIIETVFRAKISEIYVEWSVNEKVAFEVAAGAAISGYRALVAMKQVGLNVCSDPVMNLSYIGVKGGLVLVVADDPGPLSSQTEQDTRNFAYYAKLPLFDPSSPEEAYEMTQKAFEVSEKFSTPVILRTTTRVSHSFAGVCRKRNNFSRNNKKFEKDSKWVCFPALSYKNHIKIEERFTKLEKEFEKLPYYHTFGKGSVLIVTSGINYAYAKDAINYLALKPEQYVLVKVATIPMPEQYFIDLLKRVDKVIVIEELDSVIERNLYYLLSKVGINKKIIRGRLSGDVKIAGENTIDETIDLIKNILGIVDFSKEITDKSLELKPQAANLCAGCSHRAAFYAVKQAMKGKQAIYCGDIGCYTLGKMEPLNMMDTCLCMGASITMGLGMQKANPNNTVIAFIGDSTFFHTGIQGVINGIYNNGKLTIVVLDNLSTAMTGGQSTPETSEVSQSIQIEKVLYGLGVPVVQTVSPFELEYSIKTVQETVELDGIKAIIFRSPCKFKFLSTKKAFIKRDVCNACAYCIKEIGCPAMHIDNGIVKIDKSNCNGCGLCVKICKRNSIFLQEENYE
ncbi:MAG: indolepyruvate ferredoxin oxidoreductase subunit alpha [Lachnospiraceae bacterium]|nr:indolepyruvate ferredoxin oxidoreductase subunit alpha [Lachnospiraceae bacterium]